MTPPVFGIDDAGLVHHTLNATLTPYRTDERTGLTLVQIGYVFGLIFGGIIAAVSIFLGLFFCRRLYKSVLSASTHYLPI